MAGGYAAADLAKLGYQFVPGPSGHPSDYVMRQVKDNSKGFEWHGQENYDAVGDAVVPVVQSMLTSLCGLQPLPLPASAAAANSVVYATPDFEKQTGPLLLLVCGIGPGGAAGIWGRALCVNTTLLEGAMFDYIARAKALGWAVLVANPNVNDIQGTPVTGSECQHLHLQTLWNTYVKPFASSQVLVVAHSYGGPALAHLFKTEPSACERIQVAALTDAGVIFPKGKWTCEVVPKPGEAPDSLVAQLAKYAALAPLAFQPPSSEVAARIAQVCRNFVASPLPPGTPMVADLEGVPAVSAGHEKHPSTTHSATEPVFAFLQEGAAGRAGASNDELRGKCPR